MLPGLAAPPPGMHSSPGDTSQHTWHHWQQSARDVTEAVDTAHHTGHQHLKQQQQQRHAIIKGAEPWYLLQQPSCQVSCSCSVSGHFTRLVPAQYRLCYICALHSSPYTLHPVQRLLLDQSGTTIMRRLLSMQELLVTWF